MDAVVIGAEDSHIREDSVSIPQVSRAVLSVATGRGKPAEKPGNVAQITHRGELWLYCGPDFVAIIFRLFGKAPGFEHDPLFSRCRHFELARFLQFVSGQCAIGPEPVLSLAGVQERHLRRKTLAGAAAPASARANLLCTAMRRRNAQPLRPMHLSDQHASGERTLHRRRIGQHAGGARDRTCRGRPASPAAASAAGAKGRRAHALRRRHRIGRPVRLSRRLCRDAAPRRRR